jgi:hypothetical protein
MGLFSHFLFERWSRLPVRLPPSARHPEPEEAGIARIGDAAVFGVTTTIRS